MAQENKNKKRKFIIVSPRNNTGGAIVLHAFCKYLNELGYDARMFYVNYSNRTGSLFFWYKWYMFTLKDLWKMWTAPWLSSVFKKSYFNYVNIPITGLPRKLSPSIDEDTIVVYPEVMHGSFWKKGHVVRWMLYYHQWQEKEIDREKDLFVCYRHEFNDPSLNPDEVTLCCPYYNLDLYKRTNYGERHGKCYVVRKGRDRADLPDTFDGPVIDDFFEPEKVRVMNESEYCISYDTQTAYNRVAALCGCISVLVPEIGKDISAYRNVYDTQYGVAIGFSEEQIRYAKDTVPLLKEEMENLNAVSKKSVADFAAFCEAKWDR